MVSINYCTKIHLWASTAGHSIYCNFQVSPVHVLRQAAMKLFTAQGDSLLCQVPHVLTLPSDLLLLTE